ETQFEQLRDAGSADLVSQGRLPWRLLAYLLSRDERVEPLRRQVSQRLLTDKKREEAQTDLNRMLVTLWTAGYITLEPKPPVKSSTPGEGKPDAPKQQPAKKQQPGGDFIPPEPSGPSGLFGELLAEFEPADEPDPPQDDSSAAQHPKATDAADADHSSLVVDTSRGFDLENYRPQIADPTNRLPWLLQIRSVNPQYGVYMADHLAAADPTERILALESVLEVPGTVARHVRVPSYEELPAGPLAKDRLDPRLLQLGLATMEELTGGTGGDDEEEEVRDQGQGRVMFEDPKVWPLTLGEKIHRLFQYEYPRVDDVRIRPVWIIGELKEFDFDFNKYITARKLQKDEGILFRHCLRMVMLLDEMANIPPLDTQPEDWEDQLDDLAESLSRACRAVDPQSTDEMLAKAEDADDGVKPGRRTENKGTNK
ncbi:MAG: helicase, partial [Planctomycetota bacterium]